MKTHQEKICEKVYEVMDYIMNHNALADLPQVSVREDMVIMFDGNILVAVGFNPNTGTCFISRSCEVYGEDTFRILDCDGSMNIRSFVYWANTQKAVCNAN